MPLPIAALTLLLMASPAAARDLAASPPPRPIPEILLRPIPDAGSVPTIPGADPSLTSQRLQRRHEHRAAATAIEAIRRRHFGSMRVEAVRREGLERLRDHRSGAALLAMHAALRREGDDVRLAMLDHFDRQGSAGQAALAFVAIHEPDAALRGEATRRLRIPADPGALAMLDEALRDRRHEIVNRAGWVAGHLQAIAAIPHLIFAQVSADPVRQQGDLAWIAIGTQVSYVADLVPVVGAGVGAFQPIVGTIYEGVVLQVQDAVAYTYRSDVHHSLVALTSWDLGEPTDWIGFDPRAWRRWFNETYVPFNLARREQEAAAR